MCPMDTGKNAREKIHNFLKSHEVAVLSTISYDNTPYAAAIYVVSDDSFNFFFLTKTDTKKSRFIMANHNAALTIVDPVIPMTLQATGTVSKIDEPDKFLHMFIKIAEENAQKKGGTHWPPPVTKIKGPGDLAMYKFEPAWLRLGDFSGSNDITITAKNIFLQLIPKEDES
jgi:uncharacterized protein YhbP (UPF0306 family)